MMIGDSKWTMGRRKQAGPEMERDKSGWEGEGGSERGNTRTCTNETMAEREQSGDTMGPCLLQVLQLCRCVPCECVNWCLMWIKLMLIFMRPGFNFRHSTCEVVSVPQSGDIHYVSVCFSRTTTCNIFQSKDLSHLGSLSLTFIVSVCFVWT